MALALCSDRAVAEELAHDAWVAAYRRHQCQPIEDVVPYVHRAVVNGLVMRVREHDVVVVEPSWARVVADAGTLRSDRRGVLIVAASIVLPCVVILGVSWRADRPTVVLDGGSERTSLPRPASLAGTGVRLRG